jgi:two-component system sensor histidine kinase KdpD
VRRGRLRIYIGAAAGVGTTFAMLDEALRRRRRGTEIVIGWVDSHGRPRTKEMLDELMCGMPLPAEIDIEALLDLQPAVVLVDELGRRSNQQSDSPFHWELVERLLAGGVDVIATANVQHLASLAEPVAQIIDREPDGFVPDRFMSGAEQIEIVDSTPEAIRRRIAHGNVFVADELRPADADVFNTDAFARLRLLLLRWMAAHLSGRVEDDRELVERVVVGVGEAASSTLVVRRAARLAQETGAELIGVHVADPSSDVVAHSAEARRRAVEAVGGRYVEMKGTEVGRDLMAFARSVSATQVVVGTAARSRRVGSTVAASLVRSADDIDIHLVPNRREAFRRSWILSTDEVPSGRRLAGYLLAAFVLLGLTMTLVANRGTISVATALSLYLFTVVVVTAIGGRWPGLVSALASPLIANWYLIPPYHTFRISRGENILELGVFVSASVIISAFVSMNARRTREAERARREAEALSEFALVTEADSMDPVVDLLRSTFGFEAVSITSRSAESTEVLAGSGVRPPQSATEATLALTIDSKSQFLARGGPLTADDHRLLLVVLRQVGTALEQKRLRTKAIEAETLEAADDLRTAILRAVSHDLRSPLANIKASVSSLRQTDVSWPEEIRGEFLASVESETDRLTSIVMNLLDLSRLEAGVVRPSTRVVGLDEVLPTVIDGLGGRAVSVDLEDSSSIDDMEADPALLERVLGNLIENALHWSPQGGRVTVRAHSHHGEIQIHVIDHGPGISDQLKETVVQPFHRLGDSTKSGGLGLGLSIADRMIAAMGGRLELRDTPGGGLTAVVMLPRSEGAHA